MEQQQIVSGFSDLKGQFLLKTSSSKSFDELSFHFSLEDNFLLMHDFEDHSSVIALALFRPESKTWRIFVEDPSLGKNLMRFVTDGRGEWEALKYIKELYQSYGFW